MKRSPAILALTSLLLLAAVAPQDRPLDRPPADLEPFLAGHTTFAFDLHRRLARPGANLICSPYSATAALVLAQSGARGVTAQQITTTLGCSAADELESALARVRAALADADRQKHVEMATANGLWAQRDYGFTDEFLQHARDAFAAETQLVDFTSGLDATRAQINSWVRRQTRGKISDALLPGNLSGDTRLVFVNTLYFKGQWASRFPRGQTRTTSFQVAPGHATPVPMMRQSLVARYAESDTAQWIELRYTDSSLAMMVLLPRSPDGLAQLEQDLSWGQLTNWIAAAHWRTVDLELPRFKFASRLPLIPALGALGLTDAFDPAKADFTGMTPRRPLWIYFLEQCAVVEVDEEGTVAAAATSGGLACSAQPRPATFHARHPFLFLIRDNSTGAILFLGRVANPT